MLLRCPQCGAALRVAVDEARLRRLTVEGRCRHCGERFDIASLLSDATAIGAAATDDLDDEESDELHEREDRPTLPDAPSSRRMAMANGEATLLGRVTTVRAAIPRQRRARWQRLPPPDDPEIPQDGDEPQ